MCVKRMSSRSCLGRFSQFTIPHIDVHFLKCFFCYLYNASTVDQNSLHLEVYLFVIGYFCGICKKKYAKKDKMDWIGCDGNCGKWFH